MSHSQPPLLWILEWDCEEHVVLLVEWHICNIWFLSLFWVLSVLQTLKVSYPALIVGPFPFIFSLSLWFLFLFPSEMCWNKEVQKNHTYQIYYCSFFIWFISIFLTVYWKYTTGMSQHAVYFFCISQNLPLCMSVHVGPIDRGPDRCGITVLACGLPGESFRTA